MKHTLCWDCTRSGNTCPWLRNFTPVKGWEAEKTKLRMQRGAGKYEYVDTYKINKCPLFRVSERVSSISKMKTNGTVICWNCGEKCKPIESPLNKVCNSNTVFRVQKCTKCGNEMYTKTSPVDNIETVFINNVNGLSPDDKKAIHKKYMEHRYQIQKNCQVRSMLKDVHS